MDLAARPFVRLVLYFIAGIFTASLLPVLPANITIIFILVYVFLAVASFLTALFFRSFHYRWITGLFPASALFLSGFVLYNIKMNSIAKKTSPLNTHWKAELLTDPEMKAATVKTVARLFPAADTIRQKAVKSILFLEKDSVTENLQAGDMLLINARLRVPNELKNPGSFDYRKYLARQGIGYLTFVSKKNLKALPSGGNRLRYLPDRIRKKLISALKENGLKGNEYAVASAILLGYDRLMDSGLEQKYSAAGAVHVLCVSGLHVGIIYLIFNFLLSFFGKTKRQRFLKAGSLLLIIWVYAVLTGLSPSVRRASVMISLFIIGDNLQRDSDKYNTLAASAFILLLINPMLLFDVGFQLSYAAVLGILIIYQPLYGAIYVKNKIIDLLWSVTALSVSAQAGAFPVAAHYFHTFPTYFLLTNIAVFALAYLIVFAGIAFLLVSPVKFLALILGKLLSGLVFLLNYIVEIIASLPGSQLTGLWFPWLKVAIIYTLILSFFFWLWKKDSKFVIPFLGGILALSVFQTIVKSNRLKQNHLAVYHLNKGMLADFINGTNHILLSDSVAKNDSLKIKYAASGYDIKHGFSPLPVYTTNGPDYFKNGIYYRKGFFKCGNKKGYLLYEREAPFPKMKKRIKLDYLVVTSETKTSLQNIAKCFDIQTVILTAGLSKHTKKRFLNESKRLNIKYYDIGIKGAFVR